MNKAVRVERVTTILGRWLLSAVVSVFVFTLASPALHAQPAPGGGGAGEVRRADNGVCHCPASPNYNTMTRVRARYASVSACLADGGRLHQGGMCPAERATSEQREDDMNRVFLIPENMSPRFIRRPNESLVVSEGLRARAERLQALPPSVLPMEGLVKRSLHTNICYAPTDVGYDDLLHFSVFPTVERCHQMGGQRHRGVAERVRVTAASRAAEPVLEPVVSVPEAPVSSVDSVVSEPFVGVGESETEVFEDSAFVEEGALSSGFLSDEDGVSLSDSVVDGDLSVGVVDLESVEEDVPVSLRDVQEAFGDREIPLGGSGPSLDLVAPASEE